EEERIEQGEDLVDRREQQRERDEAAVAPQIGEEETHRRTERAGARAVRASGSARRFAGTSATGTRRVNEDATDAARGNGYCVVRRRSSVRGDGRLPAPAGISACRRPRSGPTCR